MTSPSVPSDDEISLPPPVQASSVGERKSQHQGDEILHQQEEGVPKEIQKGSRIPYSFCALCKNSKLMLFLLESFRVAFRISSVVQEKAALPYLGLAAAPLYFVHALAGAKKRLILAITAAKVDRCKEFVFNIGKTIQSVGGAVETLSRTLSSSAELLGLAQMTILSLIFTFIVPRLLLATGSVSGAVQIWSILKHSHALLAFQKKRDKKDVASLIEALEFLRGPIPKEEEADTVARENLHKVQEDYHKSLHFTSDARYVTFKTKIEEFFLSKDLKVKEAVSFLKIQKDHISLSEVQDLFETVVTEGKPQSIIIQDILTIYERIEEISGFPEMTAELNKKKESLRTLLEEGNQILDVGHDEMKRTLFYHILFLLITALILTASSLLIDNPENQMISQYLFIAASSIDIGYLLFEKFVPDSAFKEVKERLGLSKSCETGDQGHAVTSEKPA